MTWRHRIGIHAVLIPTFCLTISAQIQVVDDGSSATSPDTPESGLPKTLRHKGDCQHFGLYNRSLKAIANNNNSSFASFRNLWDSQNIQAGTQPQFTDLWLRSVNPVWQSGKLTSNPFTLTLLFLSPCLTWGVIFFLKKKKFLVYKMQKSSSVASILFFLYNFSDPCEH